MAATTATVHDDKGLAQSPVVLDIGKQKKKQIKLLREGKGKLLSEINASIQELRTVGSISATAQPIIVIIREKRRKVMKTGLGRLF